MTAGCIKKSLKDLKLGGRCDEDILVGVGGEEVGVHGIKICCMEFSRNKLKYS